MGSPQTDFLTKAELLELGPMSFGENVQLSRRSLIIGAERICIGSNVRIDAFCIISAGMGGIKIGSHVHIAAYCSMQSTESVTFEDFSGLSSRCSIYSSNDDYTGIGLSNPTAPLVEKEVVLERLMQCRARTK